ncbi:DUF3578 domain-containing protein [Lactiplantibacillus garii]|uniref:DUF3578 domain-containing protein n=1 Tax=Lactiplantibacillus garii TaxID=2306423 RepID=A0A3R8LHZ6_9LACO|nr:DUF3578 domain-containing protein [Lactiplantibacillus garii]
MLEYILHNYPRRDADNFKNQKFKGSESIQKLKDTLQNGLNGITEEKVFLTNGFTSKGSAGNGNWATVPWIALFNTNISTGAQKGFDVVYLFSSDLRCVYLSLNQGWSFYKNKYGQKDGLKNIAAVAKYWQNNLFSRTDNMSTGKIDLHSAQYKGTSLPLGYERGNILSIKYETHNLPSNERLIEDLLNMKLVLTELEKSLFSPKNLDYSISYIIKANGLGEDEPNYIVQKQNQNIIKNTPEIQQTAAPKVGLPKNPGSVKAGKMNYEDKERNNSKIGFLGEILVINFEKKRLEEANRCDLSKKIEHVSRTQGDGLGYDIVSYTDMGVVPCQ